MFIDYRIYGDKAPDIIDGLKKNPVVAVPLVLRRYVKHREEAVSFRLVEIFFLKIIFPNCDRTEK
jgi:hypothetical protein